METNKTIKRLYFFRAASLKPAPPIAHSGRIVLTLLMMLLTTNSAWADTGNEADGVYYIDATGTQKNTATDGIDGNDTPTVINIHYKPTTLSSGWYVVTGTVNYTSTLVFTGDTHLILADDCQMNVGGSNNNKRIDGVGIYCHFNNSLHDLTFYGQAAGNGALSVYTKNHNHPGIAAKNLTINGGNVTANTTGSVGYALYASDGNLTINGGTVEATSANSDAIRGNNFIYTGGNVNATASNGYAITAEQFSYTFTWSNPTDCITIGSTGLYFDEYDNYTATFSKGMTNGLGNIYSGTLNNDGITALNTLADSNDGLTLYPYVENLNLSANAHNGNYWTTFYCGHTGYKINDEENAWAYTAEYDGANSQLTLHKLGKVIPKNKAVIIVGEDNSISMTASTDAAENDVENDLHGKDVRTLKSTLGTGTFYVLSKKNSDFGFFEYTADYMPARKAYLLVNGGAALARGLSMVFDHETTGIVSMSDVRSKTSDVWYSLDGRRMSGQPSTKGFYINNGRKIVIK